MTDEIVIIGAGIIGVACARALQIAGHPVRILDPRPPGDGCSFGNAGLIAIDHVLPLARPEVLWRVPRMLADPLGPLRLRISGLPGLAPWLLRFAAACRPGQVRRGTTALASLLREAMPAWERAARDSALDTLFRRAGALVIFERERAHAAAVAEERCLEACGVRFRHVDAKAVRAYAPGISAAVVGGRFYPDAGHVLDPHALVTALAAQFVRDGGAIERSEARGFVCAESRVVAVRTATREIPAKQVVLAAGARSAPLAKELGVAAPLVAERGYHVMLETSDVAPEISLTFAERGFVATQMKHGLRLAGTVELGCRSEPDWRRARILHRHMRELFPGRRLSETSRWFGDRPTFPDYLPMIGCSPRLQNAILALGHQHLGLTLAAITAEVVRDLASTAKPPLDLTAFRPDRFDRTLLGHTKS